MLQDREQLDPELPPPHSQQPPPPSQAMQTNGVGDNGTDAGRAGAQCDAELCIPKCCDVKELYNIDSGKCEGRRLQQQAESGRHLFHPEIFNRSYPHWSLQEQQDKMDIRDGNI